MKLSKPTKSNEQYKILRMISRNEELERNQGKWVAMNRAFKNKKKYNRKDKKKELRKNLNSYFFIQDNHPYLPQYLFCLQSFPLATLHHLVQMTS